MTRASHHRVPAAASASPSSASAAPSPRPPSPASSCCASAPSARTACRSPASTSRRPVEQATGLVPYDDLVLRRLGPRRQRPAQGRRAARRARPAPARRGRAGAVGGAPVAGRRRPGVLPQRDRRQRRRRAGPASADRGGPRRPARASARRRRSTASSLVNLASTERWPDLAAPCAADRRGLRGRPRRRRRGDHAGDGLRLRRDPWRASATATSPRRWPPTCPALVELAEQRGVPVAGKDGKTGQTMMKTVLAPAFRSRALRVEGWYSTNILGNRDGLALDDPASLQSKLAHQGAGARLDPRLPGRGPRRAHRLLPAARRREGGLGQHRPGRLPRPAHAGQGRLPVPRLDPRGAARGRDRPAARPRAAARRGRRAGAPRLVLQGADDRRRQRARARAAPAGAALLDWLAAPRRDPTRAPPSTGRRRR